MEDKITGKLNFSLTNQGVLLQIDNLYPYLEDGEEVTVAYIKEKIKELNIIAEVNDEIIDAYLKKSILTNKALKNIIIASGKSPIKKNSSVIEFSNKNFSHDSSVKWSYINTLFKDFKNEDIFQKVPFRLMYVKKGDVIAKQRITDEDINGVSVTGDIIPVGRFQTNEYYSGENVLYDESKKSFIAGCTGYVTYKENTISVFPPFFVTNDKMALYFLCYDSEPEIKLDKNDVAGFLLKEKIDRKCLLKDLPFGLNPGASIVIAEGKLPGTGKDAVIEILVDFSTKNDDIDDDGKVDYREVKQFPSVNAEQLLAKKILPVKGENGYDVFGNAIMAKPPKDILLKNGINAYKVENDNELLIYSKDDGLIDYKNGILSVFPQLHIPGDIDFSTGNINTKVNVHINGNVKTGFTVKSERNVFIKGIIEDNCVIEAGGDLIINGGSTGPNNKLSSQGNMSIKFIEGGEVFVRGKLSVQRFILSAKVECLDTITVMGSGINLNEKGAIIDCDIFVKTALFCPTIGNDTGVRTDINFGFDRAHNQKINNLIETIQKIKQSIEDLKSQFEDDITSPNIFTIIKGYAKTVKDDIIKAIQEKNKLENQLTMMNKILEKEIQEKKNILKAASVQVSKKVFPPLGLESDSSKKVIDTIQPPSKYYLDLETKWIERSRYLTGNEES